jgi:hypothetical protein
MRPDLEPLLKNLPPRTKAALVQAINACSKQLNMAPDWVQRWLSFTVVADALTRYATATGALFEIKGGAAIEMRMRRLNAGPEDVTVKFIQPRATRDLDATFRGEWDALQRAVEAAFAEPHLGFAFRAEAETLNAYSATGAPLWSHIIRGFKQVRVTGDGENSLTISNGPGGSDQVIGSAPLPNGTIAVQVGYKATAHGNPQEMDEVRTYMFDAKTGRELTMYSDAPERLISNGSSTVYSVEPYPKESISLWQSRPGRNPVCGYHAATHIGFCLFYRTCVTLSHRRAA